MIPKRIIGMKTCVTYAKKVSTTPRGATATTMSFRSDPPSCL